MENATKALLIAVVVLIAILLIALGIKLLNSNADVTEQSKTTSETAEVQAFNAQFIPYEGQQKGTAVSSLVQAIITNNKTNTEHEITPDITFLRTTGGRRPGKEGKVVFGLPEVFSQINKNAIYEVSFTEYDEQGHIKTIRISD